MQMDTSTLIALGSLVATVIDETRQARVNKNMRMHEGAKTASLRSVESEKPQMHYPRFRRPDGDARQQQLNNCRNSQPSLSLKTRTSTTTSFSSTIKTTTITMDGELSNSHYIRRPSTFLSLVPVAHKDYEVKSQATSPVESKSPVNAKMSVESPVIKATEVEEHPIKTVRSDSTSSQASFAFLSLIPTQHQKTTF
ncbi:hypothetical protein EJ05DRAFT_500324 [Pseudovirgaria hyperparasitica]|uniref:Uncharacterized protein n=1 Tax=Pseudovirgaria hyperparasitica TaxID=470096 RepID=A0A6A6W7D8_9PEZI|nr:uncharacterized protein EJ05DRAFT_500324 [Pseudovirgaria hyperparasitica]KAF2758808.1 hypothetical protein EJ05DRAFT_500324 [Pseudovirgaria hyperparasitica]